MSLRLSALSTWGRRTMFKWFLSTRGEATDFYSCIYLFRLFVTRALIPQLSRDSAAVGPDRKPRQSKAIWIWMCWISLQGPPACVHSEKDFSYFSLRWGWKVFLLCGWEWASSVYVTKRANATLLATETKTRESFDNNMSLFIEFNVYYIYNILLWRGATEILIFFFFYLFKCVSCLGFFRAASLRVPVIFVFSSFLGGNSIKSDEKTHSSYILLNQRSFLWGLSWSAAQIFSPVMNFYWKFL